MFRGAPIAILIAAAALFATSNAAWLDGETTAPKTEAAAPLPPFDQAVADAKKAMATSPMTALAHAERAEALAPELGPPDALTSVLWLQGEALTRLNRPDDAQPVIERAISLLMDPSSKLAGDLLLSKGRVERVKGEVGPALESFQSAYRVFEDLGEQRSQAIALQSIGTLYSKARQYQRAIEYNERASAVFSDGGILDLVSLNNRANAYRELEAFDEANGMLSQALTMAEASGSALLQVRILTNVAVNHVERKDFEAAETALSKGFALATSEETKGWLPFLWGARAELACALNQGDVALQAIQKTFDGVDLETTTGPFRDFHEAAYKVYQSFEMHELALAHLSAFKRLDDEGREIAASANNALINAEFELANKEIQIERLRADQFEKDVELTRSRMALRRVVGATILLTSLSLIAFLGHSYRSAKRFAVTLGEKNSELSEANVALQDANQAKLEFLAVTSHEIRTPLNAIIGLSDVMLGTTSLADKDHEFVTMINQAGSHLLEVVNDILDVSKLEAGQLTVHPEPTNVAGLVGDVAAIWRKAAEDKGLTFNINIDEAMDRYVTDPRLIRQTVSNLLSNAVKFTAQGSISISCRPVADGGFDISVRDTGIGISEDQVDLVFEAFRQADGRKQRNYGGTGLGLAICKRVAQILGGDILLNSAPGEGSEFILSVPAEATGAATGTEQSGSAKPSGASEEPADAQLAGLNILVAEDNPTNAMVIRAYLTRDQASVTIVENGLLAVEAVQSGNFDIVLMDKQMPVLDGYAATRAIRELAGPQRNIPIVAVTADAFEESSAEAISHGMNDFVSKPLNPSELKDTIRKAVAPAQAVKANTESNSVRR
ncbi:MAG: ATP-binding protein [Pseudomonadota bacterium]